MSSGPEKLSITDNSVEEGLCKKVVNRSSPVLAVEPARTSGTPGAATQYNRRRGRARQPEPPQPGSVRHVRRPQPPQDVLQHPKNYTFLECSGRAAHHEIIITFDAEFWKKNNFKLLTASSPSHLPPPSQSRIHPYLLHLSSPLLTLRMAHAQLPAPPPPHAAATTAPPPAAPPIPTGLGSSWRIQEPRAGESVGHGAGLPGNYTSSWRPI